MTLSPMSFSAYVFGITRLDEFVCKNSLGLKLGKMFFIKRDEESELA